MQKSAIRGACTALIALGMVFGSPTMGWSQNAPTQVPAQSQGIIVESLTLKDADLVTATRTLTQLTGLQFIVKPSNKPFSKVTLDLKKVPAEDALKYICEAAGAYYKQDVNGVFIISQDAPAETEQPLVKAKPELITKKISLLHADPRTVYEEVLGIGPFKEGQTFDTRIMDSLSSFMKGNGDADASPKLIAGDSPKAMVQPIGNSYFNQPMTGADSTGHQVAGGSEQANQFGGGGLQGGGLQGGGGIGGQGGGIGGQGGGIGGQGGLGGQQQQQVQGGQGYVPQSITNIVYDPSDNSIIVEGTEEDIAKLQKIIADFDTVPKQVQVKVEFITTTSSSATSLGFDWMYARGTISTGNTPGSFADASNPIFLNFATGNVTTRLRTQLQNGYGKEVAAPIITTMNNQPAAVFSQTTTYIELQQTVLNGNLGATGSQLYAINSATTLGVAPRINNDGTITMFLRLNKTSQAGLQRLPDGQEVPNPLTEGIIVTVRVKDGETIVLGGLNSKVDSGTQAKFPILGDLPVIGQFFRQTTKNLNNVELLIFVTPTVIPDDSSAGSGF